jgi:hypothetical protein
LLVVRGRGVLDRPPSRTMTPVDVMHPRVIQYHNFRKKERGIFAPGSLTADSLHKS